MNFLDKQDFEKLIKVDQLDTITGTNDHYIEEAEAAAIEEMSSYLRSKYDTDKIFSQTGDDRSDLVMLYLIDLTLYHLFTRLTPRNVPDIRISRYERVIDWLERVQMEKVNPDLPEYEDADKQYVQYGSRPQRIHHF
jgi:hypothetical protein